MHRFALLVFLSFASIAWGAEETGKVIELFRLYPRDVVRISVQGEPDVGVERQIDGRGEVNVPLLGAIRIGGLTIADAQTAIADRYVKDEIFIHPEVVLTVTTYAAKEVTILGQIGRQGKVPLPAEMTTMPIVEAIAAAGGLTRIAKGDAVRVTRRDDQGNEQTVTVNVDKMVEGRGADRETFLLQPGDVVFVPERVF